MSETLSRRDLNRATLARQMLLGREAVTPLRAIERLVGMQAQEPRHPFIGLWTRLKDFRREHLTKLVHGRTVVRATAMRCTLHLLSAPDYAEFRAPLQAALSSGMRGILGSRINGVEFTSLLASAREHFDSRPCTFESLREHLAAGNRGADIRALAYAVRTHLPLVQVPVNGMEWGYPGVANFSPADTWLGRALAGETDPAPLLLRYLAAFGPASVADAQAWSGLKRLGPTFDRLRSKLSVFRDDSGRELFDLPKAPRPGAGTPAPVRFIPDYDNLVLSHADRTRVIADAHRKAVIMNNAKVLGTFLIDGFVAGTWKVQRSRAAAVLELRPFDAVPAKARTTLAEEGEQLLRFTAADSSRNEVRFKRAGAGSGAR